MNDFETLLSERLNDLVDHETGPERPAPRFVPTEHDEPSKARPWLLAAAAIILAVGVSWASISWLTRSQTPPVAGPSSAVPSPTTSAPSRSGSASATPTPTSAKPSSASSSTAALAGGARIAVPAGWKLSVYAPGTGGADNRRWWCINPASTATPVPPLTQYVTENCAISLIDLGQRVGGFDPNGYLGDPGQGSCANIHGAGEVGVISDTLDVADTRPFGGRQSEFRKWTHVCEGYTLHGEQYMLPGGPTWALVSNEAETTYAGVTVSATMASIAESTTLPAQTSALWMGDDGFVRAITKEASGMTLTIDRYQSCPINMYVMTNPDTATTTYVVPTGATLQDFDKVIIGSKVEIQTDGKVVTAVVYLNF